MIQKILFNYFAGRATSLERKLIEDWLKASPEHEIRYYQLLDEWESQHPQYISDFKQGWNKFRTVLDAETPQEEHSPEQTPSSPLVHAVIRNTRRIWFVAAGLAMLMIAASFFFQQDLRYRTYHTPFAQTRQLSLPDGTQVALNANSTLWVPRWGQFNQNRTVILDGEAEFKVTHMPDHRRFVVKTSNDFEVEVFGTRFVFYAREQTRKVVLNEGAVRINYQDGKKQVMKPGDVAMLNPGTQTLVLSKTDDTQKYSAWKQHQFYFDNTPLTEASQTIREHFGLQVAFNNPALAERRLSGYFKAEKASEFFQALSILLNVDIRQQGDTVLISTKQ